MAYAGTTADRWVLLWLLVMGRLTGCKMGPPNGGLACFKSLYRGVNVGVEAQITKRWRIRCIGPESAVITSSEVITLV